jgi:hypothetical protein
MPPLRHRPDIDRAREALRRHDEEMAGAEDDEDEDAAPAEEAQPEESEED